MRFLTDEAAPVLAGTDFITQRGVPAPVARPTSVEQVAALLSYAAEHGVTIIPRGAATNLSAAVAPGDDALVLDVMLRLDLAVPIRDDVYG
jgi:glycolate oxidase